MGVKGVKGTFEVVVPQWNDWHINWATSTDRLYLSSADGIALVEASGVDARGLADRVRGLADAVEEAETKVRNVRAAALGCLPRSGQGHYPPSREERMERLLGFVRGEAANVFNPETGQLPTEERACGHCQTHGCTPDDPRCGPMAAYQLLVELGDIEKEREE